MGSGKTALVDVLSREFFPKINLAVVTNDIYTREDAEFLIRQGTLPAARVRGVETGGCPHAAIREDSSMNLEAIADLEKVPNPSPGASEESRRAAWMPRPWSMSIWSFMRAISGETTRVTPGRARAGSW